MTTIDGPRRAPRLVGWSALGLAIGLDVAQVFLLDTADGFRRPWLAPVVAATFLAELALFGRALAGMRVAVAYAAYGSVPAIVAVTAAVVFRDPLTPFAIAGVALITLAIIVLSRDERTSNSDDDDRQPPGSAHPPRQKCSHAAVNTPSDRPASCDSDDDAALVSSNEERR